MTDRAAPGARVLARTPHPTPSAVADALADAFLAAEEWSADHLIEAGAFVLGARRRWLRPLVADVLESFARPPVDAPRLLAAHVRDAPAYREAVRKANERGSSIRIAHRTVTASPSSPRCSN